MPGLVITRTCDRKIKLNRKEEERWRSVIDVLITNFSSKAININEKTAKKLFERDF